jgi:hypothetical protein
MKREGTYQGIPVYSSPDCLKDTLYVLNEECFERALPKRKDGKLDMRYSVNKLEVMLKNIKKNNKAIKNLSKEE